MRSVCGLLLVDEAGEPEPEELRERVAQEDRGADDCDRNADEPDGDRVALRRGTFGVVRRRRHRTTGSTR